jgi:hypothetical protein
MLTSFEVMNDMFSVSDKGCFLANKRWKKVMRDDYRLLFTADTTVPREWVVLIDDYFEKLVEIPQILKWGFMVREANRHSIPVDPERIRALDAYSSEVRAGYLEWYKKLEAIPDICPTEVPSEDPSSIYDTVFQFGDAWGGTFYLGYWASMLIVQETINQTRRQPIFAEENRLFVRNIYRSVETLGKGIMGPFRLGYAIRIAYEFSDVRTQTWLRMWLDRFSETYAATTKSTYPPVHTNEYGYS